MSKRKKREEKVSKRRRDGAKDDLMKRGKALIHPSEVEEWSLFQSYPNPILA
jgi:hypothetical protein